MITKISETGSITCEAYVFSPGTYPLSEFTAGDLVKERNELHIKIQYDRKVNPTTEEMKEIEKTEELIKKISVLIDQKFDENGKEVKT